MPNIVRIIPKKSLKPVGCKKTGKSLKEQKLEHKKKSNRIRYKLNSTQNYVRSTPKSMQNIARSTHRNAKKYVKRDVTVRLVKNTVPKK